VASSMYMLRCAAELGWPMTQATARSINSTVTALKAAGPWLAGMLLACTRRKPCTDVLCFAAFKLEATSSRCGQPCTFVNDPAHQLTYWNMITWCTHLVIIM
jgi:hypothetical protein